MAEVSCGGSSLYWKSFVADVNCGRSQRRQKVVSEVGPLTCESSEVHRICRVKVKHDKTPNRMDTNVAEKVV
jgi:hypothetical protein